jgi:hypothetical protein
MVKMKLLLDLTFEAVPVRWLVHAQTLATSADV